VQALQLHLLHRALLPRGTRVRPHSGDTHPFRMTRVTLHWGYNPVKDDRSDFSRGCITRPTNLHQPPRIIFFFPPQQLLALPTQGSSWGYLKVNSSETLSIFGDTCPQNGSKNDLMAPRTTLECPHEGPSVDSQRFFF